MSPRRQQPSRRRRGLAVTLLLAATLFVASTNALSVTVGDTKIVAGTISEAAEVKAALIAHPNRNPDGLQARRRAVDDDDSTLSLTVGGTEIVAGPISEAAEVKAALVAHPMRNPDGLLQARDHDPRRATHGGAAPRLRRSQDNEAARLARERRNKRALAESSDEDSSELVEKRSTSVNTLVGFNVANVANKAISIASHSWEYGILTQALLEFYNTTQSVFAKSAFPDGKVRSPTVSKIVGLNYAAGKIATDGSTLADGDGSLGDPASLLPPAILIGSSRSSYASAAKRQMAHLHAGPRFYNGAISQREDVAELWADAMYMIPPSLAYYSPFASNVSYITEAYYQCKYYREVLQANTTADWKGLWTHIVGPQSQTLGIWLTGNGWAALGMLRVYATILHWERTSKWTARPTNLKTWIYEILAGAKASGHSPDGTGLLANYLVGDAYGQNNDAAGNFGDATGTAMLVAVVYRMAVLDPTGAKPYLTWANNLRKAVASSVDSSTGVVSPVVNPLNWYDYTPYTSGSPEGQSAAVLMAAAYRDCVAADRC